MEAVEVVEVEAAVEAGVFVGDTGAGDHGSYEQNVLCPSFS